YSRREATAIIAECTSGLELEITGEALRALDDEFAKVHEARPILLAVEGRIEAPAGGGKATLVPTSRARFWPGESCGARGVTHDLEGSRWVLVRLGDQPVTAPEGRPEPYLVLQGTTKQIAGHAGCNRLSGGYRIA